MSRERLYPPDWLDTDTASYMVSMSGDTFNRRVDEGMFPLPVVIGGKRLWHRGRLSMIENSGELRPSDSSQAEARRPARSARRIASGPSDRWRAHPPGLWLSQITW